MDFFDKENIKETHIEPLAYRMRPENLSEYAGQKHILGEGKLLLRAIQADRISSLVLYGPAGVGKTALAFVISRRTSSHFESINAVNCGVEDVRKIIKTAVQRKKINNSRTILFVDEIHRFNKSQQDVLMPAIEEGGIILIGATTFNPFHALIPPLISRSLIFELKKLSKEEITALLKRALADKEKGLGNLFINIQEEAVDVLAVLCDGDARKALTALEIAAATTPKNLDGMIMIDKKTALESIQKKMIFYDKTGDGHYDTISAFIKSLRGSDADAAVYWLAKMLYAEEDPRFIARRMIIFASEDIGNANPEALSVAVACYKAVEVVGMPEAKINLSQAVCYLATSLKNNASYIAINEAYEDVQNERTQEVPDYLKSAGYSGAERLGRGKGYIYPHDHPQKEQDYLKEKKKYYRP
ncbi:MAG: replication-associated recombination protein A [Candidatus Omnitrophota bacterium]